MMIRHLATLLVFFLGPAAVIRAGYLEDGKPWEEIYVRDGIKVFRKEIAGTRILGMAGESTINADSGKIIAVMADVESKPKWVDRMISNTIIEQTNPTTQVEYSYFHAPWPVSNREFVYRIQARYQPEGESTIAVKSVLHPNAPHAEGAVLGEILEGRYILTTLAKNKTHMRVEILMDPKGLLPSWVVNLVQKSWPFKTLDALAKRVQQAPDPDPKEYQRFLAH